MNPNRAHLVTIALAWVALSGCGDDDGSTDTVSATRGPGDFAADYRTSAQVFTNMAAPVKGRARTAQSDSRKIQPALERERLPDVPGPPGRSAAYRVLWPTESEATLTRDST